MSAFATLSLDDTTEEQFLNATAAAQLASSNPTEDSDFKVQLASILTYYYELQDLLASRGCREHATIKAESLGEAIRAVSWTADTFRYLLIIHKQDVPHVLEAIQMYLDHSSLSHPFRRGATHLIIKIADRSGHLPRSLYVEDIRSLRDHQPHGQGGYADVYKAFYNHEFIAIKRPRLIGGSELAHKRLCREALVWRQLKHANILPFIGLNSTLFPDNALPCLLSTWMEHGTLRDYVQMSYYNPYRDLMRLLREISSGLAYLHSLMITHGDISHTNILIDHKYSARLADLGLLSLEECTMGSFSVTRNGFNARWTSPQRLQGDVRCMTDDVYSFACISYYLFSSALPFHDLEELPASLRILRGERPPRPSQTQTCVIRSSDAIWNIITRCWEQESRSRPTMTEVNKLLMTLSVNPRSEQTAIVQHGQWTNALTSILGGSHSSYQADNEDLVPLLFETIDDHHELITQLLRDHGGIGIGGMALHKAARMGPDAVAQLFLEQGAGINSTNNDGSTVLHAAAERGNRAVAHLFLECGADINATDKNGWTSLHKTASNGHEEIALLLLERGADVNAVDKDGWTSLYLAAKDGHEAVAQLLLERGANINAADKDGSTPLHKAVKDGYGVVARLLLERRADVNAADKNKSTPLHGAASKGHEALVQLLLEHGADVNAADEGGLTPLCLAAKHERVVVAQLLLEHGADINTAYEDGSTPLHMAATWGYEGVARLLLERRADFNAVNKYGWTPLHRADVNSHEVVARLLLDRGAHVNIVDQDGSTPLHKAAKWGYEEITRLLLEHGADPKTANRDGQTPLDLAIENEYASIENLLRPYLDTD